MSHTTDNQTELFYHVDEQDKEIGSITRAEAHDGSFKIHRAVSILVFNSDNTKILLQKRSQTKDTNPGFWTISASGHVTFGENYEQAARKELFEEIGVQSEIVPLTKIFTVDDLYQEKEWDMIFQTFVDENTIFHLHPQEVDRVQWIALTQLEEFLQKNQFTNCGKQVISAFLEQH